jgi:hypothetical protein
VDKVLGSFVFVMQNRIRTPSNAKRLNGLARDNER